MTPATNGQVDVAFGGVLERGASLEGGPVTWESSFSSLEAGATGSLTAISGALQVPVHLQPAQKNTGQGGPHSEGQPKRRADEYEQSESPVGATTPGNGRQPDPDEQRGLVSRRT
jgi:hypothetical protein